MLKNVSLMFYLPYQGDYLLNFYIKLLQGLYEQFINHFLLRDPVQVFLEEKQPSLNYTFYYVFILSVTFILNLTFFVSPNFSVGFFIVIRNGKIV